MQKRKPVRYAPVLHELAVCEAADINHVNSNGFSRGRLYVPRRTARHTLSPLSTRSSMVRDSFSILLPAVRIWSFKISGPGMSVWPNTHAPSILPNGEGMQSPCDGVIIPQPEIRDKSRLPGRVCPNSILATGAALEA